MTRPARFRETDITRAVKALEKAGLTIARIDVNDNGASIVVGEPASKGRRNPLDRLHAA